MSFIGREAELVQLEEKFYSQKSELAVIYGRRRVGKSSLVEHFYRNKSHFKFEGIEGLQTSHQIEEFARVMGVHLSDQYIGSIPFKNWQSLFQFFTEKVILQPRKEKLIIFFDEIQWMAAKRQKLISIIKLFWDNQWKNNNVMLVLCGSVASYVISHVIRSKALYGRISLEMLIKGLKPSEAVMLFKGKRSREEVLQYLLVFGGIPKYLEEIDLNKSFQQNMNRLCFSKNSIMFKEVERIFYSQFKEATQYINLINALKKRMMTQNELSNATGISSGGSLKNYLEQLQQAELVGCRIPFNRPSTSKLKKYYINDEFINFYTKYMEPNLRVLEEGGQKRLFEILTSDSFPIWSGFAFERYCLKNAYDLSMHMGFGNEVILAAPHFERGDTGYQIDLLYKRADSVIVICEIKHKQKKITTEIISEMEKKIGFCRKVYLNVNGN